MSKQVSPKPSIFEVIMSVLGAFFGVQSSKTRERDFTQGHSWWVYVLVGIFFATLLVILLLILVKTILFFAK